MWMMVPFILNVLLNFVVSLLVAKFLGPAEYGRFVLALSAAVTLQVLLFDWLRLATIRFYSERDRLERPQIRATLDAGFGVLATLAALAALVVYVLQIDLVFSADLMALAIGVSLTNGLFEFASALMRARFLDKAYGGLVVAKNVLAFLLTVGGAVLFGSAKIALVGMMLSVAGSLCVARRQLIDANASIRRAERTLAARLLAYGLPIVIATLLYQTVPLMNRSKVFWKFIEYGVVKPFLCWCGHRYRRNNRFGWLYAPVCRFWLVVWNNLGRLVSREYDKPPGWQEKELRVIKTPPKP